MMARVSGNFRRKVVPLPGAGFDVDRALQAMQHALHDIEANAPAGNFGDFIGGAESGPEDKCMDFGSPKRSDSSAVMRPFLDSLVLDSLRIDAAAIVADLDDHLVALVVGREADGSMRRLAGAGALPRFRCHDDRIANQMRQRLGDGVEKALVQIGVLPADHQFDVLPHCLATSRTMRGKRRNSCSTGTMRIFITERCRSFSTRD